VFVTTVLQLVAFPVVGAAIAFAIASLAGRPTGLVSVAVNGAEPPRATKWPSAEADLKSTVGRSLEVRRSSAAPSIEALQLLFAVLVHVSLTGFFAVLICMMRMATRGVGVVGRLFVVAALVVLCGFSVVLRGVSVMFGGLFMVFNGFLGHSNVSSLNLVKASPACRLRPLCDRRVTGRCDT
jgi:hypothetical protein